MSFRVRGVGCLFYASFPILSWAVMDLTSGLRLHYYDYEGSKLKVASLNDIFMTDDSWDIIYLNASFFARMGMVLALSLPQYLLSKFVSESPCLNG